MLSTIVTTSGEKIGSLPSVVGSFQADVFVKVHYCAGNHSMAIEFGVWVGLAKGARLGRRPLQRRLCRSVGGDYGCAKIHCLCQQELLDCRRLEKPRCFESSQRRRLTPRVGRPPTSGWA